MVIVIFGMVLLDAVHPPAVSTARSFAFGAGAGRTLELFELCMALILLLLGLQRATRWLLARVSGAGAGKPKA